MLHIIDNHLLFGFIRDIQKVIPKDIHRNCGYLLGAYLVLILIGYLSRCFLFQTAIRTAKKSTLR